jgi:thymidylate synthase
MKKSKNSISSWLNEHRNPEIDKLIEQQAKQIMKQSSVEQQYLDLLQDILDNGVEKKDRTGTGTLSVFGRQVRHKMSEGYPLLTTKKMAFKTMVKELLWFLKGDTNIKYLVDNNCNIWNGDAYKNFLKNSAPHDHQETMKEFINRIKTDNEFAQRWGELGPIYGHGWRNWNGKYKLTEEDNSNFDKWNQNLHRKGIDQIQNAINLLKTDPDSRRNRVDAWNVGEVKNQVVPPCHTDFQFYTRELSESERGLLLQTYGLDPLTKEGRGRVWKENNLPTRAISLMWNQRSVDTGLGLGFNIASYGLLLKIIAKEVNMIPDELIGNLGDVHLYKNHIEGIKEQLTREPFSLPELNIKDKQVDDISEYEVDDFELIDYQYHPSIKLPLSN